MRRIWITLTLAGGLVLSRPQNTWAGAAAPIPDAWPALSSALPGSSEISGWTEGNEGQRQYRLADGTPVQNGWIKDGDAWYYFDENGSMVRDAVLVIGGHLYRFDTAGIWTEEPAAKVPFAQLPSGTLTRIASGRVYQHPWAGIRISLPWRSVTKTAEELRALSAHDYVPSYYDFLTAIPDMGILGVLIQYNPDPIDRVLADDLAVFSNFWGQYDLCPSDPAPASVAGYPCEKISCSLPGDLAMDIYLRGQDNKVLYVFAIVPAERRSAADTLIALVQRLE